MSRDRLVVAAALGVCLASAPVLAGPEWEEDSDGGGDAGSTQDDAQVTIGTGFLTSIAGKLAGLGPAMGDFQDVYCVFVPDPFAFSISTASGGGTATFDTQLFVFNAFGMGQLANDDVTTINSLSEIPTNASDDGSGFLITIPGIYYIAISGSDSDPLSIAGLTIFDQPIPTEVSGPDGITPTLPLFSWTAPGETGSYLIKLTGVRFAAECPGDANGDLVVDVDDLLITLGAWGTDPGVPPDFDEDGDVDIDDLLIVLANWGACFPT